MDLDAIAVNLQQIKEYLGGVRLLAVVKADAYGLGAVAVSRLLSGLGIDKLGVVTLDEAEELRRADVDVPILNMGPILPQQAEAVVRLGIEQMVFQPNVAAALSRAAVDSGAEVRVHLKIDTGMSRYGIPWQEAVEAFQTMRTLPGLQWHGAMTHFPISDATDKSFALLQIERFKGVRARMAEHDIYIPLWHICNSGGVLDLPQAHMDMVRVGLMLYGYYPSDEVRRPFSLRPSLRVQTHITTIRTLHAGDTVGYGRRYTAERDERIAVLPIGYADGYDRKLRNIGRVLLRGRQAPIIGGLCMDACFINISEFPDVAEGEPVLLMGRDGDEEISPHDIAALAGSVSYEVMARLGKRLPRVYKRDGKVIPVSDIP